MAEGDSTQRIVRKLTAVIGRSGDPFMDAQNDLSVGGTAAVTAQFTGGGDGVAIQFSFHTFTSLAVIVFIVTQFFAKIYPKKSWEMQVKLDLLLKKRYSITMCADMYTRKSSNVARNEEQVCWFHHPF